MNRSEYQDRLRDPEYSELLGKIPRRYVRRGVYLPSAGVGYQHHTVLDVLRREEDIFSGKLIEHQRARGIKRRTLNFLLALADDPFGTWVAQPELKERFLSTPRLYDTDFFVADVELGTAGVVNRRTIFLTDEPMPIRPPSESSREEKTEHFRQYETFARHPHLTFYQLWPPDHPPPDEAPVLPHPTGGRRLVRV